MKSATSSTAYVIYNGSKANCISDNATYNYINASGGNTIYNMFGGSISNSSNIIQGSIGNIATDIFGWTQ